jgi:hypothetical protein
MTGASAPGYGYTPTNDGPSIVSLYNDAFAQGLDTIRPHLGNSALRQTATEILASRLSGQTSRDQEPTKFRDQRLAGFKETVDGLLTVAQSHLREGLISQEDLQEIATGCVGQFKEADAAATEASHETFAQKYERLKTRIGRQFHRGQLPNQPSTWGPDTEQELPTQQGQSEFTDAQLRQIQMIATAVAQSVAATLQGSAPQSRVRDISPPRGQNEVTIVVISAAPSEDDDLPYSVGAESMLGSPTWEKIPGQEARIVGYAPYGSEISGGPQTQAAPGQFLNGTSFGGYTQAPLSRAPMWMSGRGSVA